MTKLKLVKATASVAASLGLMAGVVGLAGASPSLSNTGPQSSNKISSHMTTDTKVKNDNKTDVQSNNSQVAKSGDAEAKDNTTAGDAGSGDTGNTNGTDVEATVDNTGGAGGGSQSSDVTTGADGSIDTTGPQSKNDISSNTTVKTTVSNDNNVQVKSNNDQYASSGDAKVEDNTTGGDATSGAATNANTTIVKVNTTN